MAPDKLLTVSVILESMNNLKGLYVRGDVWMI